jgi:hypothetical protein
MLCAITLAWIDTGSWVGFASFTKPFLSAAIIDYIDYGKCEARDEQAGNDAKRCTDADRAVAARIYPDGRGQHAAR